MFRAAPPAANPDSKKAVRRRKDARERQPEHHSAGLGDEIEAASLATSRKSRGAGKRARAVDEDEARRARVLPPCCRRPAAATLCPAVARARDARPPALAGALTPRRLAHTHHSCSPAG
jgi:hypothetical protein